MKKLVNLLLIVCMLFSVGCAGNQYDKLNEENEKNLDRLSSASPSVSISTPGTDCGKSVNSGKPIKENSRKKSLTKKSAMKMKYTYNPYFPDARSFAIEYKMSGWFLEWGDEPLETYKVKMVFNKVKEFSHGKLYEVRITQPKEKKIPADREDLDYFFVQRNKIYSVQNSIHREVSDSEFKKLKKYGTLPRNSTVICQENGIEDRLKEGKRGWHQLLEVDGNRRWYRSWEQLQHRSGWWESFVFQKGLGLVGYKSGSSAGVDYIILSMRGLKIY